MYKSGPVHLPYSGDLEHREFSLGVPTTEQGAIVLGAVKVKPDARIAVNVEDDLISIRREDGKKIQIVERRVPYNPTEPTEDVVALSKPVKEIRLRPDEDEGYWAVDVGKDESLVVEDSVAFQKFASTVVEHALSKQIMEKRQAAIQQIHDHLVSIASSKA